MSINLKRLFILSCALACAAAVALYAQLPDPYSVAAFNITDAAFIETNNFVIKHPKAVSGSDTLLDINSPPPFIRPGQVVMRRKYGADYRLYIGDLDTNAFRAFPPIYSFPIPSWSRSGQVMWYRIYPKKTENRNLDVETVYFDNERIYVQHHDMIHYSRNDKWDSIPGVTGTPYGELHLDSEPPGADIYLYGKATGKRTPAELGNMIAGKYEVELFLPEHRFGRRSISVPNGGVSSNSFQLISDFDTLLVLGENQHGILVLPYPPIDSAYRIGDTLKAAFQEQLLEGEYRITWHGGGLYKDIDTVIFVPAGHMTYFNAPFVRLSGTAVFEVYPEDALLCVEGFPCFPGDVTMDLPSGFHTARASRHGYEAERHKFIVSHGKTSRVRIYLTLNADRDGDGLPDSVDRCPDDYGLYNGCPKPDFKTMAKMKYGELEEYMMTEPLSFTISAIGYISRTPTNGTFRNMLSSFSGGLAGGLNNYQGLTVGNIYQVSYRGFMAQAELGQWASGVRFRRPDTLIINTENDKYIIQYDSIYQIDPAFFFPSTALSAGFKYRLYNYSVGYSLGYQWEEIILDELQRVSDKQRDIKVIFDNNWWFHEIMVEADMFTDTFLTPALYAKFKFPFGPTLRTRWHVLQFGLQMRLRPANWKKRHGAE